MNFDKEFFSSIDTVIFDLGGVLVDLDKPRAIEAYRKLGFKDIDNFMSCHLQRGMFLQADSGLVSSAEFRNLVREHIGNPQIPDSAIDSAWTDILVGLPQYRLDTIKRLREKFRTLLLSNISEIDWDFCLEHYFSKDGYKTEDLFEKMFLSYRMKVVKPNPEIMEKLIADSGIDPNRTMFIDDAPANCRMAEAFGIRTYTPAPLEDWTGIFKDAF